LPLVQVVANSSLCAGETLTLSATGALNYIWKTPNGSAPFSNLILPAVTSTDSGLYVLTAFSSASCAVTQSVSVIVNPIPNVTVAGPTSICAGGTATLIASGGNSYQWSNSSFSPSLIINPNQSTSYTVIGSSNGCTLQAIYFLTVNKCLGISENLASGNGRIFPNPSSKEFFVELDYPSQYIVNDATGRIIKCGDFIKGINKLSLKEFAEGIYYLFLMPSGERAILYKVN